ncbi:hypothetical protein N7491_007274 [Penicillium cf. griseofulvum]|uniref:DUF7587 domain-containing protein n=1 Tax=Penicillium cf. griseofulvum TaxID=2972120 RepID=A0A9W9IVV8_9EURO|nr:hypothetical protein N7472_009697 [Penicillium cf. griseofulvum]KAJ5430258.1 hypothetical protein N7491_007274 [Penicillium cf. griseofulvum]
MENQRPPRRPKLRWDIPMRQALCCIYRFFRCDKKAKEEIFFFMFQDKLKNRGISRFVPDSTLHTQWIWMRYTGDLVWAHVHRDTEFNMDGQWKDIIQRIKSTAVTLRLPLPEKIEDDIDTTQWGTRTPHRMPFPLRQQMEEERSHYFTESEGQTSDSSTLNVDHSQERIDQLIQTDHLERHDHLENIDPTRKYEPVVTSHGKICLWCGHGLTIDEADDLNDQGTMSNDLAENNNYNQSQQPGDQYQEHPVLQEDPEHQEHLVDDQQHHDQGHHHHLDHDLAMQGVPRDKMPPLLFRWSNRDSQGVNSKTHFLAGLFCESEWFDPEDLSETRFESLFRRHVTKEKIKTPFISTFRSPLAPFHRALAGQNSAILTVIDTSKLKTKVFYAHPLAIRTRTLVLNGWKGYGEYLIWGRIPTEGIAFSVEIISLQEIAQAHRDINRLMQVPLICSAERCNEQLRSTVALKRKSPFQSGRTLAKLLTLLQVPAIYWENLAIEFCKAWGWRHEKEIALFLNGFRSAPPYLPEELSDSESEGPWLTPQKLPGQTHQRMEFSSEWVSDVEYEPPDTDEETGSTSDSEEMAESRSISMCDMTETADDGNFSTHETMSSGVFPEYEVQHQEVIDLTSDNEDSGSQHALQLDWPSDDEPSMYQETPTKIRPPQSEQRTGHRLVLNGEMDMDFFEKFRHSSDK